MRLSYLVLSTCISHQDSRGHWALGWSIYGKTAQACFDGTIPITNEREDMLYRWVGPQFQCDQLNSLRRRMHLTLDMGGWANSGWRMKTVKMGGDIPTDILRSSRQAVC